MQQDPFYFPMATNYSQDPRLQYQNMNPYPMQPNVTSWCNNSVPTVNVQASPNLFQSNPSPPVPITPVSVATYGTTATCSWAHKVPSLMPWAGGDPVVRFTAPSHPPDPCTSQTATSWELLNNLGANKTTVNMHLKRKNDLEVPETAPQKLCITEERMAARLKELHISNRYSVPTENSPFGPHGELSNPSNEVSKPVTNLQQLEVMLKESQADNEFFSKSLILAPELKKLVEPEKMFANTFLDKVERPSMAVVLWKPQNNVIPNIDDNTENKTEDKDMKCPESSVLSPESNNNFLPPQLSTLCSQSLSFNLQDGKTNSEEVMDT